MVCLRCETPVDHYYYYHYYYYILLEIRALRTASQTPIATASIGRSAVEAHALASEWTGGAMLRFLDAHGRVMTLVVYRWAIDDSASAVLSPIKASVRTAVRLVHSTSAGHKHDVTVVACGLMRAESRWQSIPDAGGHNLYTGRSSV